MPYESKWYALEEWGVRRMARHCEPTSVWGTALTMGMKGSWTVRDDGNKSEGNTSKRYLRYAAYTESANCPFCF